MSERRESQRKTQFVNAIVDATHRTEIKDLAEAIEKQTAAVNAIITKEKEPEKSNNQRRYQKKGNWKKGEKGTHRNKQDDTVNGCGVCGRTNHFTENCRIKLRDQNQNKPNANVICSFCNKPGHYALICRSRLNNKKAQSNEQENE